MSTEAMICSVLGGPSRPISSRFHPRWRKDWSNLADGPAGLVAERLLADDVADYIRFRTVCRPWRQLSTDPCEHGILDRRFHPHKWTMLREIVATPDHIRLFLNVSTGQCIRVRFPKLCGHRVFGPTTEGLLVLLDRTSHVVRLLNPLTGLVTHFPPTTSLLHLSRFEMSQTDDLDLIEEYNPTEEFEVLAAGLANDSTFAVYFRGNCLVVAKPGDECWMLVDDQRSLDDSLAISFEGRFYCPTDQGLMAVDTSVNQPRLVLAAELTKVFRRISSTIHLVDNGGELILVYRNIQQRRLKTRRNQMTTRREESVEYKAYQVDLKAMNTKLILGLGGRAIFIGLRSALTVSTSVFPSIKSESIYAALDLMLGTISQSDGVYCLMDGITEPYGMFEHGGFDVEYGSEIGPSGIDDYLSWHVTNTHQVGKSHDS